MARRLPGYDFMGVRFSEDEAVYFLRQLRSARNAALADAEDAASLLTAFERLGYHRQPAAKPIGLSDYRASLLALASRGDIPDAHKQDCAETSAADLFDSIQDGRNEHMHVGVSARRLVDHAVRFAVLLEAGLMADLKLVKHFMVIEPLCAEKWQTVALVRQLMLLHQFSFLPYRAPGDSWKLVADHNVVAYLRSAEDRGEALAKRLEDVVPSGTLKVIDAQVVAPNTSIETVLRKSRTPSEPFLVVEGSEQALRGILSPFDLL